jgi:DNA-binding GntR family transcriptional regulator
MRPSLSDQMYEAIKGDIMACTLKPGQQIAQNQLAEKYDSGLTPVREALQRLAQEGFVEAIPRFGYVVSPITLSDIRDLFEMRAFLEAAAARLTASRASDEELRAIAELADSTVIYRNGQALTDFVRNAEFHRRLGRAAGNLRLKVTLERLMDELMRVFNLGLDLQESGETWKEEHAALAQALLQRDVEGAGRIAYEQVIHSQRRVLEALARSAMLPPSPQAALSAVVLRPRSHQEEES